MTPVIELRLERTASGQIVVIVAEKQLLIVEAQVAQVALRGLAKFNQNTKQIRKRRGKSPSLDREVGSHNQLRVAFNGVLEAVPDARINRQTRSSPQDGGRLLV